ncbi:hypothetical protein ISG33_13425 [Glaciecola sp. MH2013]|uniref:hypothetical protein n=1 Tax=Glaciecola sp. MH2013 TaxID=2785524 RepID=UPI0018A038AE|nr:hypothetical protein [Glaciecola sp. MH2013]MBF7074401.1 hypothetical protein [Glaciecola sp. MH2013]
MNYLTKLALITQLAFVGSIANANAVDLVVVANIDKSEFAVSKRELRDLFMGNSSELALTPIALDTSSEVRSVFNTKVIGLTESRIQSYWAQMRFSGRKKPPKELKSIDAVLDKLVNTENSVAYLPADTKLPDGLVVVYRSQ